MNHPEFGIAKPYRRDSGGQLRTRPLPNAESQRRWQTEITSGGIVEWVGQRAAIQERETVPRRTQSPSLLLHIHSESHCRVPNAVLRTREPLWRLPVQQPTKFEHSRRFPDQTFSHSPQRSSPVITFHFAAMKCFGSPCDLVQPRLRNLLTGFAGFKTLNKFPNQAGAILYRQQQNLLTQLFQCHRYAFRGDSCVVMPHCGCAACAKSMSPTCEWEAFEIVYSTPFGINEKFIRHAILNIRSVVTCSTPSGIISGMVVKISSFLRKPHRFAPL